MSNKRITDLTELTTPTTDDVFPVVDIATNTTTKVQLANLPVQTAVTTALATKQATLVSGTNIKTINSTTLLGSGDVAVQPTLVSGVSIKTVNSTSLLGSGDIPIPIVTPSGVAGAIQFSNGSAFASDATNFFWDNTNKRLGVGLNNPTNTFEIASTSADPFKVKTTASYFRATFQNASTSGILDFNSGNFQFPTNSVDFGTSAVLGARVGIKGSGSTSATTSLLVQNSAGSESLKVTDDGITKVYGLGINATAVSGQISANLGSNFLVSTPSNVNFKNGITDQSVFFLNAPTSSIGINNTSPNASASFDIASTTKGFLMPRMTTTQINAIASPANGLEVYNTTLACPCFYDGTSWRKVSHTTM